MLEGEVSHDRITRFLSKDDQDSRTLWQQVKPMVRKIEQPDGALIFDDTIEEKPPTDENEIVSWHFDHSKNRTLKGISILNCVYHAQGGTLPVAYEIIRKPIVFEDENTGRLKRRSEVSKSEVSKNELMRRMLKVCQQNRLEYRHVLADSWFSSKENLGFIPNGWGKEFIIALKSNRTAALSHAAKLQGGFHRIDTLGLPEDQPVRGWLRGLDFPILLLRQVFKNKDGSAGTLYLACSDLDGEDETISKYCQSDLPEKVESGDVSQDAQGQRRTGQVAREDSPDSKQPLFHGYLLSLPPGMDQHDTPDESLCLENPDISQSCSPSL